MKIYKTIIVGGGISGLSAARKLFDNNEDFLLISKELGGRMHASKSFGVDYGAAYMTQDYKNVLKYVEKGDRLKVSDLYFINSNNNLATFYTLQNLKYLPKILKFLYILKKFRRRFIAYRKKAPYKSIQECFEEDKFLLKLWNLPASEFIKKNGFEILDEYYGNPVTNSTAFVESDKINTVYYLGMFFPTITKTWSFNFKHTIKKLIEGYEDKIKIASVIKVEKKEENLFKVHTSKDDFFARNIIFAAPQIALKNVYDNLPEPHLQEPVYSYHVAGLRRDIYQNKKVIFFRPRHHTLTILWHNPNGADLVYTKNPNPDFREYYEKYHIVKKIHWNPAIIIPDNKFVPQELEKNVYLASDYNISGLEDSFITGLYAANQILKNND